MPAWVSSPVHRAVVASLIEARKAAGLTQRDVATRLGRPPSFVGKVESIERNLSVLEFIEWCEAVKIDPADLIREMK
jgi:transcriptional regulator with XRE-family HTH domain